MVAETQFLALICLLKFCSLDVNNFVVFIGDERTMVFVDTKKKADFIATFLCQEKISTTSIHG